MPPLLKVAGFETYMDCFQSKLAKPRHSSEVNIDDKYTDAIDEDTWYRFAGLSDDLTAIDTGLEALLALYHASGVVSIKPVKAEQLLPQGRASALKLASATYRELVVLKFLDPKNITAIGRFETMLKFLQDKHGLTRAEIEKYYRDNIRGLVSEIVDKNIAKSRFGKPTAQALTDIKSIITQFFLNPTRDNLIDMHQRFRYYANTDGDRGDAAADVLENSVYSFNLDLGNAVLNPSRLTLK